MNLINPCKSLAVSLLLAAGLAACDANSGPAERAGRQIDQSASEAGKKLGETLDKIGQELDAQGAKTAVAVDDAEITTRVKAAIFAEPGLMTLQISVDTEKGVVTLSGSVATQQDSDRAQALAGAVAGVNAVNNRLLLKSR